MELFFDNIQTPTLTKADLSDLLFEQLGFNKREAKDFIDELFDVIIREIAAGREVKISEFGNFLVRSKNVRPGRNPRTGEAVVVAARRTVSFQASPKLKSSIQSTL